jgi:hypothetical protein
LKVVELLVELVEKCHFLARVRFECINPASVHLHPRIEQGCTDDNPDKECCHTEQLPSDLSLLFHVGSERAVGESADWLGHHRLRLTGRWLSLDLREKRPAADFPRHGDKRVRAGEQVENESRDTATDAAGEQAA